MLLSWHVQNVFAIGSAHIKPDNIKFGYNLELGRNIVRGTGARIAHQFHPRGHFMGHSCFSQWKANSSSCMCYNNSLWVGVGVGFISGKHGQYLAAYTKLLALTHWGRDKIDAILQTAFSSAYSWMKMYKFGLKFNCSLFLKVLSTILQHWYR